MNSVFLPPRGVWPVMLTPFDQDKKIDWSAFSSLTEYYLQNNVAGIFAVCGSSEMFELSWDERLKLVKKIIEIVNEKCPIIVSGIYGASLDRQSTMIKQVYNLGACAVILLVNQLADENEPDDVWKRNTEFLLSKTKDIPLGLYECPTPYHRLMSPKLLKWTADTDRFVWMKETSENIEILQSKIHDVTSTTLQIYNADSRIQLQALKSGVNGYCGIATNFYPDLLVWLNRNYLSEPTLSAELQQFFNDTHPIINNKYLNSAKYYAKLSNIPIELICRGNNHSLTLQEMEQLIELKNQHQFWQKKLNLKSRRD
ncbi:MAG: dihydrodipicolinate synthase family protein [Candidatus Marinimicrobia bacterium]|nr:dihydrodipicolinate synthase family protein [Candidatus Neomarinimicrobiota bacterium]